VKTLAFLSQKGGSGKTMLSVHLAVAAEQSGERVCLVDTDPQASATAWAELRTRETPLVVTVSPSELPRVLDAARTDSITFAVVDTPPHAAPSAAALLTLADIVLVPCRPTAFDLAAVLASVELVRAAQKPAAFILNACPPRAPEVSEALDALSVYGFPCAPIPIGDRRAFSRSVAHGRAVTEFDAKGKAAAEIRSLFTWLRGEFL
jgi:chromosome partitioning protein